MVCTLGTLAGVSSTNAAANDGTSKHAVAYEGRFRAAGNKFAPTKPAQRRAHFSDLRSLGLTTQEHLTGIRLAGSRRKRLESTAPARDISDDDPLSGFQFTTVIFPTPGVGPVTSRIREAGLTITVKVVVRFELITLCSHQSYFGP